jgi:peptidyl-prolyl cis-trans isomerase SurA
MYNLSSARVQKHRFGKDFEVPGAMKKLLLCLTICLAAFPAALKADTVVEEIIARVNNQIITRSEYSREREQLKQEAQQQDAANADKVFSEREKDILRGLIDQQLMLEKGKDLGITADTDLVKRLDEIRKQMNLESMDDLEKAAQAQGVSFEDFKQNMRNQIITQKVIGQEVGSHIQVTKDEEQAFYESHKNDLKQPDSIRLSEILVAPQKNAADTKASAEEDPQQLAAAEAKAKELLEQIRKGASFEELAKKSSNGPSAAQGGNLGEFKRGTLSKELEDTTFAMKSGEVSDVIRTKQGFVILKVTDHKPAGTPALKDIEPKVQEAIYMQKLEPALRSYLTKLREDAFIQVKSGYVDTGASARQSNPVETTIKEANAKKLKKKKKLGIL